MLSDAPTRLPRRPSPLQPRCRCRRWGGAVFPLKEGIPPRIKRRVCAPDPYQQIGLVPYVDTVHNRLTVEIRRGCTRGCRCRAWRGAAVLEMCWVCGGAVVVLRVARGLQLQLLLWCHTA